MVKPFRPSVGVRIRNAFTSRPRVLLLTLWRSGTHWMADMLSDMLGLPARYRFVDGSDYGEETLEQIQAWPPNTILVRHICLSPRRLLDATEHLAVRIVLLYRDPRDVIASNVNMRKYAEGYRTGLPPFPDMSVSEILDWELQTYGEFYSRQLPGWIETEHPRMLRVRYEKLRTDVSRELERIARFLGVSVPSRRIAQIAAQNSFEARTGRGPGTEDKEAHCRKGIIGDYKNQFCAAEQARLNGLFAEALSRIGYPL